MVISVVISIHILIIRLWDVAMAVTSGMALKFIIYNTDMLFIKKSIKVDRATFLCLENYLNTKA